MAGHVDRPIEHLLRRAGFGATRAELDLFDSFTPSQAVDTLVFFERIPDDVDEKIFKPGYAGITTQGAYNPSANVNDARQRWLFRMLHSERPLQEKMTLFWH